MGILDDWLGDIPQQFQGKEHIKALISAFAKQLEELHGVFKQLDTETDLESAVGMNLDMVGDIVALTRKDAGVLAGFGATEPVMSDKRYRQFLRYKILKNTNNCTYYDIMQSIAVLWEMDNIKYYEDPCRPATILIRLQTTDVDLGIDPTFGKVFAIKPSGVALVYTVVYIVTMDYSLAEKFYFAKIRLHIAMYFWYCRMFDGSWSLDGSVLMDASRRYGLALGMRHKSVIVGMVDDMRLNTLGMQWKQHIWEESDGCVSIHLAVENSSPCKDGLALTMRTGMDFSGQEEVADVSVETKTRDYWFLDGALLLDGVRNLNSICRKELAE